MSSELLEELEVLSSIYGKDISWDITNEQNYIVKYIHETPSLVGTFMLMNGYPEICSPQFSVSIANKKDSLVYKERIESAVNNTILDGVGEVILFNSIQSLREYLEVDIPAIDIEEALDYDEHDNAAISLAHESGQLSTHKIAQRNANYSQTSSTHGVNVIHGPVTEESKSTFQSHAAKVYSMNEVELFKEIVMSDKKTARATHNIFAYRFTCPHTGILHHDNDDDGETAAGGRLGELLRLMNVQNYAVIVSRVFGGVKLGPNRFKLISNSARKLLEDCIANEK